jgi:hypothetical protein
MNELSLSEFGNEPVKNGEANTVDEPAQDSSFSLWRQSECVTFRHGLDIAPLPWSDFSWQRGIIHREIS